MQPYYYAKSDQFDGFKVGMHQLQSKWARCTIGGMPHNRPISEAKECICPGIPSSTGSNGTGGFKVILY